MISIVIEKIKLFFKRYKNELSQAEFDLLKKIVKDKKLNHIAITPDGERRWACERGKHPFEGHKKSAELLPILFENLWKLGIHTTTLWWMSPENLSRSSEEVVHLFTVADKLLREKMLPLAMAWKVKIIHLGNKDAVPPFLLETILYAEQETKNFDAHIFNIGINYGSVSEIVRAVKRIMKQNVEPEGLTEDRFMSYLETAQQPFPNPDLMVRFGRVYRLSGFMAIQGAYSELYFPQAYFPEDVFLHTYKAIKEFGKRRRTLGK